MQVYQLVALGLTVGLTVVCFIIWVWQMMVKRRRLEDDVERMKDELSASNAAHDSENSDNQAQSK